MRRDVGSVITSGVILLNERNSERMVTSKINTLLDQGFTKKDEIISKVAEEFGLEKSKIRRVIKNMLLDFRMKERVLNKQYENDMKND